MITAPSSTGFAALRSRVQRELFARLPGHVARLGWHSDRIAAHQREHLRRLLTYAATRSRFHAPRLAGVEIDRVTPDDLRAIPIMTRAQLMAHFDSVVTDARVTRQLADRAVAATRDQPVPLCDEYLVLVSGGSSGTRGVYVQDVDAHVEMICAALRNVMARMAGPDGQPPNGLRVAQVAAPSPLHATRLVAATTAGGPLEMTPVPATTPLPELVQRLDDAAPTLLVGYPSVLARVAREQQAGRLAIAPAAVITTSENLDDAQRTRIGEAFCAPVIDSFGSTEGLFGSTTPDGDVFTFATDQCIVELVDDAGRPVPAGRPSTRVLVTNLVNRIQPLIRYEITDRFVREPDAPEHGHLRARVDGRADDTLRWGDTAVHPLAIRSPLSRHPEVADHSIRQTVDGVDVSLLCHGPCDTGLIADEIRDSLSAAGVARPAVSVTAVDRLDRDVTTGKLRRIQPLPVTGPAASLRPA